MGKEKVLANIHKGTVLCLPAYARTRMKTPWGSYKFVILDPDGYNLGFVNRD